MSMIKLNIHEIKTQLSKYIDLVEGGETVLVCKRNIPVAEIRSIEKTKQKRKPVLGWAEGQGKISLSFDEPMSKVELRLWEAGDENDPLKKYAPKPAKRTK
jgi:prevent-host-death family protein